MRCVDDVFGAFVRGVGTLMAIFLRCVGDGWPCSGDVLVMFRRCFGDIDVVWTSRVVAFVCFGSILSPRR